MTTAIDTLQILPSSMGEVSHFAAKLVSELQSGTIDPLMLIRSKKSLESLWKDETLKSTLDELALREAEKYPKGRPIELMGMKITVGENGTNYDYSNCNDPVYNRLKAQEAALKEEIKGREAFLKALKTPLNSIDDLTGEVITINPPVKSSTTGLKVQLV